MSYAILNDEVNCTNCRHADMWGRGCSFGLMFPVAIFLTGNLCPNFEGKTSEQIEEQLTLKGQAHNE